jgi:hypothetical protein
MLEAPHTPVMASHVVWNNAKDPASYPLFDDHERFLNQESVYLDAPSPYSLSSSPHREDLASPMNNFQCSLFFDSLDMSGFPTPSPEDSRSSSYPPSVSSSATPPIFNMPLPGTAPSESLSTRVVSTRSSSRPTTDYRANSSRAINSTVMGPDGRRNRPGVQYPFGPGGPSHDQSSTRKTSPVNEPGPLNMGASVVPAPQSNLQIALPTSVAPGRRRTTDLEANRHSPASGRFESSFHYAGTLRGVEDVEDRPPIDVYPGYSFAAVEGTFRQRRIDDGRGVFEYPHPDLVLPSATALGKRKATHSDGGSPYSRDYTSSPPIIPHHRSIDSRTDGTPEPKIANLGIATDDFPAFGKGGTRLPSSLSGQPARKRVRKTKPPPEVVSAAVATRELNKWIHSSLYGELKGEKQLPCPICHETMLDSMEKHLLTKHRHKDAKKARDTWDTSSWDVKLRMIHFTIVEIQGEEKPALNEEQEAEINSFLSRYNHASTWDGFPDEAKYRWLVPYTQEFSRHVAKLWKCPECGKECGQNFSLNRHLKKNCKAKDRSLGA